MYLKGFHEFGVGMRQPKESFAFLFFKEMPLRREAMVGGGWEKLGITCDRVGCCESPSKILHFHLSS